MADTTSDDNFCTGCNLKFIDVGYMCYVSKDNPIKICEFLIKHNVIPSTHKCKKCRINCSVNYQRGIFTCNKINLDLAEKSKQEAKPCNYQHTIYKGTFLNNVNLPKWKIFDFIYLYLSVPSGRIAFITHDLSITKSTYFVWGSFVREVCVNWAMRNSSKIGGEGVVVEIDEAKFGRLKHKKGISTRQWVFGGVERKDKSKQFFVSVNNRDEETLMNLIKTYILPGSIIHTDSWEAYRNISEQGFGHLAVDQSLHFVDPVTGAHIQNIKRLWRDLRANVPHYGRKQKHLPGYLAEARFRRTFPIAGVRFHEFWKAVAVLYPCIY